MPWLASGGLAHCISALVPSQGQHPPPPPVRRLVTLVESSLGWDASAAAERARLAAVTVRGCCGRRGVAAWSCACGAGGARLGRTAADGGASAPRWTLSQKREFQSSDVQPKNDGPDDPLYYETLISSIAFDQEKLDIEVQPWLQQ